MSYPIKKLGEVLDYEQPGKYIVNSKHYSAEYKTPVLTAGKTFILGNTNEKENIFPAEKLPVIIFDDFTTAVQFVDFPFKVKSSAMKILHPKKNEADAKYIFYLMQTIKLNHVTHKRYWISEYSEIQIPLPTIAEQRKIVAKLEKVLGKIKEAKKLREEAESAAAALLPAELHKIFSEGKKKGWEEINFGQENYLKIIDGDRGKNYPTKSEFERSGYCLFLNTSNVRHGVFNFDRCDFISKECDEKLRKGKLERGDIVLTTRGTLGNSAFYDKSVPYDNLRINSGMVILRVNEKVISQNFLLHVLNSPAVIELIKQANSGSAQPQLPIRVLSKLKIPLPPIAEQKKIVARLDALSAKVQSLRQAQTQTASDFTVLEQSVLHKAFNN